MDFGTIGGIIGALCGVGAMVNSFINTANNKKNAKAVTSLEHGKLDLGVAGLGLQALQAALEEIREQLEDCHADKEIMSKAIDQLRQDLLTK